jgi:hypothetical protein
VYAVRSVVDDEDGVGGEHEVDDEVWESLEET